MFTGLVEALGRVVSLSGQGADRQLRIASGQLDLSDVKLGDSIATNGVCLTVTALFQDGFSADVSAETLACSSLGQLQAGSQVNLEKALQANSRLGGHLVSGHVDGLAQIVRRDNNGRAVDFWLQAPPELARYIAEKGSVTLDGISLTVNSVADSQFRITLVPHSQQHTTVNQWRPGSQVNLEVDLLARYVERLLLPTDTGKQAVTHELLARSGFIK